MTYLDKSGLHEQAARVRAAHGRSEAAGTRPDDSVCDSPPKRLRAACSSEVCSGRTCADTQDPLCSGGDDDLLDWCDNTSQFIDLFADDTQEEQRRTSAGARWSGNLLWQPVNGLGLGYKTHDHT